MEWKDAGTYKWTADEYVNKQAPDSVNVAGWEHKERTRIATTLMESGPLHPTTGEALPMKSSMSPLETFSQTARQRQQAHFDDQIAASGEEEMRASMRQRIMQEQASSSRKTAPAKGVSSALLANRGKMDFSWCAPKKPSQADKGYILQDHKTIEGPSTKSWEGQMEASRVLGAAPADPHSGQTNPVFKSTDFDMKKYQLRTCNQMYGALAHEREQPLRFVPRNTCDECLFVNAMVLSKTPYNPSIRF